MRKRAYCNDNFDINGMGARYVAGHPAGDRVDRPNSRIPLPAFSGFLLTATANGGLQNE